MADVPANADRRRFLVRTGQAVAALSLNALLQTASDKLPNDKRPEKVQDLTIDGVKYKAEIGKPEVPIISGIDYFPDGHSSFNRNQDGLQIFLAGATSGYLVEGRSFGSIGAAKEILHAGSNEQFDRDYAAPGSVIPGKNPGELLMFYHGEYHPQAPNFFPFNAGIGLATSKDNGNTWQKQGQILKGMNDLPAVDRVFGAGQPSAITKDGYIYLYYVDWNKKYTDSIHLARSPIDANGKPGTWEKFNNGQFTNNGMDGESTPVIEAGQGDYAALPGISWNTSLGKYVMVHESLRSFDIATSKDGITWDNKQPLLEVQTINNNPTTGQIWNGYPTLWSTAQHNDRQTDNNLTLVYAEGKFNLGPHSMRTRSVKLVKSEERYR